MRRASRACCAVASRQLAHVWLSAWLPHTQRCAPRPEIVPNVILLDDIATILFSSTLKIRMCISFGQSLMLISLICLRIRFQKNISRVLFIVFPAFFLITSCARSPNQTKVVEARILLGDNQMDSVTAGSLRVDLELSSDAQGPTASMSTQGSIRTAQSTVLRIAVDTSAPEAARARLLGVSTGELVFAMGKADAVGTSNAQCSASPVAVGDAAYVVQSRNVLPTSATCSCSAFAIGIVAPSLAERTLNAQLPDDRRQIFHLTGCWPENGCAPTAAKQMSEANLVKV